MHVISRQSLLCKFDVYINISISIVIFIIRCQIPTINIQIDIGIYPIFGIHYWR